MANVDFKLIDDILVKYDYDKGNIIAIMQAIQEEYRYLPQQALEYVAGKIGVSMAKIFGVATFYENFSMDAKGKYVIKVCRGTACHVRKSANVLQAVYDVTGLNDDKHTTEDGLFTVEVVSCLGACGLAPVVVVNEEVHSKMTPEKVQALIAELRVKEGV